MPPSSRRFAIAAAVAIAAVALVPASTRTAQQVDVIATGLDNPRGLSFGPDGALYVAEAGRGGDGACFIGGEGAEVCYGATGAVTRIASKKNDDWWHHDNGSDSNDGLGDRRLSQFRILRGLPSLAPPPGAENAGGNAIGPHDVGFDPWGQGFVTIGFGSNPANRALVGPAGRKFSRLLEFDLKGRSRYTANLGNYEAEANPDEGLPDTDPFGLLVRPFRRIVADAGANAIIEVAADGTISTLAVFPDRTVNVPFPGFQMQSVPTSVVRGPDGALYVGQLTGFPFPPGGANVYRVPSHGGTPQIFASGFTNIIDIAFGHDGSLYVLEIAANGLLSGNPAGALIRVRPNGTRTEIASGALTLPGGFVLGGDGIYVTTFTTAPGGGQVVRIRK